MSEVGDLPTGGMRLVPPRQALPTTLLPPEPAPSFPPPVSRPTSPPRPISEQRAVSPETAPQSAARHRTWRRRRLLLVMVLTLVVSQLAAVGLVASLRWVNPPTTAFLLEDGLASRRSNSTAEPPIREWVDIDAISRNLLVAIIGHEDQAFSGRGGGVDWQQFRKRVNAWRAHQPDPSGSTIDQQLAKNLFLWHEQDPVRKGVEAYLATLLAQELPHRRILELYANLVEFGPGIWGACAASWYYFGVPPSDLALDQSARLVGLLPRPKTFSRAAGGGVAHGPTDVVAWSQAHIARQVADVHGLSSLTTIGVTGLASDGGGARRCSAPPPDVHARLARGAQGTGRQA